MDIGVGPSALGRCRVGFWRLMGGDADMVSVCVLTELYICKIRVSRDE